MHQLPITASQSINHRVIENIFIPELISLDSFQQIWKHNSEEFYLHAQ